VTPQETRPEFSPRQRPNDYGPTGQRPRDTNADRRPHQRPDRDGNDHRPRHDLHDERRNDSYNRNSNHDYRRNRHDDRRYDRDDRSYRHSAPPRIIVHNHRHFRSYSGIRIGFYFAPNYGYYRVPQSYYQVRYQRGSYLPSFFLRYRINNPYDYGLPYPPYGMAYVWIDNCIALVDLYNYEIVDIYYDIY